MNELAEIIAATLRSGTPLAIAGLGLLLNERAGVVNLGAEGILLVSAMAGFGTALHSGNVWLAFGAGALSGAAMAAVFAWLTIWLNTNQYATGLAVTLFGSGLSAFVGLPFVGQRLHALARPGIPGLRDLPWLGPALFRQHLMVYATLAAVAVAAWFLYRTRAGLVLRAVGEAPVAAHALGYPVRFIRLGAVLTGGALCGVAGAYLSTVDTPLWVEGMVGGRGWIALSLTTFATWRPARILLGAYMFGGVTYLGYHLQTQGVQIPSQFLAMLPYVSCICVLVLISRNPLWIRLNMPASLGKPFYPGG